MALLGGVRIRLFGFVGLVDRKAVACHVIRRRDAIADRYQENWGRDPVRRVLARIPTYMMWVFFAIAVGGFAEEMIFRGFLINRVETLLTNKAPILKSSVLSIIAIILPALLFGFAHFTGVDSIG